MRWLGRYFDGRRYLHLKMLVALAKPGSIAVICVCRDPTPVAETSIRQGGAKKTLIFLKSGNSRRILRCLHTVMPPSSSQLYSLSTRISQFEESFSSLSQLLETSTVITEEKRRINAQEGSTSGQRIRSV